MRLHWDWDCTTCGLVITYKANTFQILFAQIPFIIAIGDFKLDNGHGNQSLKFKLQYTILL